MSSVFMVLLLIASFFGGVSVRKLPVFNDCSCRDEDKKIDVNPLASDTQTVKPKGKRTRTETGGERECELCAECDIFCIKSGKRPVPIQGS